MGAGDLLSKGMSTTPRNHDGPTARDRSIPDVVRDTMQRHVVDGVEVVLRAARLSDGPGWRTTRLRDRERLRPAFGGDDSLVAWADHVLADRDAMRAGTLVPFVAVTADGRFVGECSFAIDARSSVAECSIWTASPPAPRASVQLLAGGILRLLEARPGTPWVIAPVAVGNQGPVRLFTTCGFERAGVSRELRLYDGVPTDHDVWRLEITPDALARLRELAAT